MRKHELAVKNVLENDSGQGEGETGLEGQVCCHLRGREFDKGRYRQSSSDCEPAVISMILTSIRVKIS